MIETGTLSLGQTAGVHKRGSENNTEYVDMRTNIWKEGMSWTM